MTGNRNPRSPRAGPVWGAPKHRRRTAALEVSQAAAVRRTVFPPHLGLRLTQQAERSAAESGYKDALRELGWHVLYAEVMPSLRLSPQSRPHVALTDQGYAYPVKGILAG